MLALRSNQPRIDALLRELEDAKEDLWLATTKEHADAARADIAALQHSLWLAGYRPEED